LSTGGGGVAAAGFDLDELKNDIAGAAAACKPATTSSAFL
jgi:hypothetical protein